MSKPANILTVGMLAALAAVGVWHVQFAPAPDRPVAVRAFDEPEAAAAFYAARRAPSRPGLDPRERYRAAHEQLDRMPRFSSRLRRRLPALAGARAGRQALWPGALPATGALEAWTPLGPGNIGGRTRVLTIDPGHPDVMYAGGVSGGVWKTEDGGASWRPVGDSLANLAINALAMSPTDPRVLYVGTGEGYFREDVRYTGLPLRGGGIFVSTDGAATWTQLASTLTPDFHYVNDLVVPRGDDRVVYAATRTGVWRSTDRGQTWTPILPVTVKGGCLDLAIRTDRSEDVLFASCGTFEQATVYRSLDARGPAAFVPVLSDPGMGRTAIAIAPSDQNVVYALAASNDPGLAGVNEQGLHALFRTNRGGDPGSWEARVTRSDPTKLNRLILTNPIAASYRQCGFDAADSYTTMGWYVNSLAVDPTDPDVVFAAGVDWFRSSSGGYGWGVISQWWDGSSPSFAHADQHGLVFHPGYNGTTNQTAFALTDGGVYRTDNVRGDRAADVCTPRAIGVAWTPLNHGYGVTQFYHGAVFPDGSAVVGGTQDNGTIVGGDVSGFDGWIRVLGGDGGYVAIDPSDPAIVYAESQWLNISKSVNGGVTFASAGNGLPARNADGIRGSQADFLFITPFVIDPGRPRTLWTGGRYVFRTDDAAGAWRRSSARLLDDGLVSAITVAPTDSQRVAAGATDGRIYFTDGADITGSSTDWEVSRPREGWVTWVAYDPTDPEIMYATYGGFGGSHVYRSANGGHTWLAIDGAGAATVPDAPVHTLVVDPAHTERIYLGTDLGVLVSTDGGTTWAAENTGFGAVVTESLALVTRAGGGHQLFAFTHGRGAWRVTLP